MSLRRSYDDDERFSRDLGECFIVGFIRDRCSGNIFVWERKRGGKKGRRYEGVLWVDRVEKSKKK